MNQDAVGVTVRLLAERLTDEELMAVYTAAAVYGRITPDVAGYPKAASLFCNGVHAETLQVLGHVVQERLALP